MEDRSEHSFWIGIGGVAPVAVAGALVPLRDAMRNTNLALVLVVVVVMVAVAGGRDAGAVSAVTSALSFDFFFTKPYLALRIDAARDIESTVLLLVVGLLVGHVASRGRRPRSSAEAASGEVRRIYRLANLSPRGDDPTDVIAGAQAELISLLHLRNCRFEAAPFTSQLERLERSGAVSSHEHRFRDHGFELPLAGVELPVMGRGHLLGRFVLDPIPDVGVSLEEHVVAVALADQVGAMLAPPKPEERERDGHR